QAARTERTSIEEAFKQHMGTRASAAEEARGGLRQALASFGRGVVQDTASFGHEYNAARDEIASLGAAASAAKRDLQVHQAALQAYDRGAVLRGVVIVAAVALMFVVLFFMPVILRFTSD